MNLSRIIESFNMLMGCYSAGWWYTHTVLISCYIYPFKIKIRKPIKNITNFKLRLIDWSIQEEEEEERMWIFGRKGESGFSACSTAEEVTHGIDGHGLTAIVTGSSLLCPSLPPPLSLFLFYVFNKKIKVGWLLEIVNKIFYNFYIYFY